MGEGVYLSMMCVRVCLQNCVYGLLNGLRWFLCRHRSISLYLSRAQRGATAADSRWC